jgi:hypothetical protein
MELTLKYLDAVFFNALANRKIFGLYRRHESIACFDYVLLSSYPASSYLTFEQWSTSVSGGPCSLLASSLNG